MDLFQRISVKMIYSAPFYGHFLMQARKTRNDRLPAPMAVGVIDGLVDLQFNQLMLEMILEQYNDDWNYLLGVAEHELLHVIFKHFLRRQDRNALVSIGGQVLTLWNVATDIAINQLINRPLPLNPLTHDTFNLPKGLNAEKYYDLLLKEAQANGAYIAVDAFGERMDGGGGEEGDDQPHGGGWDNVKGHSDLDSHEMWRDVASDDDKENDLENAIVKAAVEKSMEHAKKQGKMPGAIQDAIDAILAPHTIPWNRILRQWMGDSFKVGHLFTWKRPSRRFGTDHKGKRPIRSLKIVGVIDTSGSIGDKEYSLFMSEIHAIKNTYPSDIHIIEADAAVQKVYRLKKEVDVNFKGRGGTDFRPAFRHIAENNMNPGLVVYLTDMCGTFPEEAPPYPVIWVKSPASFGWAVKEAPFGRVIEIKE